MGGMVLCKVFCVKCAVGGVCEALSVQMWAGCVMHE